MDIDDISDDDDLAAVIKASLEDNSQDAEEDDIDVVY
jgi:hypothetical protein